MCPKCFPFFGFLITLLLSTSFEAISQEEIADLGALYLSKKEYVTVVPDEQGRMVIAYGERDNRMFRVYNEKVNG